MRNIINADSFVLTKSVRIIEVWLYKIALELLPKAVVKTIDFSRIKVTTIQTFNKSYICIQFFSI